MDAARWSEIAQHRDRLLVIARRRTASEADAEDCVHEALLRAAAYPDLDLARAGAFLNVTTQRLCIDLHREQAARDRAAVRVAARSAGSVPSPEDEICDVAEARWLWQQAGTLPASERRALLDQAGGASVAEVAMLGGLSLKAAENALGRARGRLRRTWRRSVAALVPLIAFARRGSTWAGGVTTPVLVPVVSATLVLTLGVAIEARRQPATVHARPPAGVAVAAPEAAQTASAADAVTSASRPEDAARPPKPARMDRRADRWGERWRGGWSGSDDNVIAAVTSLVPTGWDERGPTWSDPSPEPEDCVFYLLCP